MTSSSRYGLIGAGWLPTCLPHSIYRVLLKNKNQLVYILFILRSTPFLFYIHAQYFLIVYTP